MQIFSPGREGCTGVRLSCWAQLAILPREINCNMDKFSSTRCKRIDACRREQIDEYAARMNVK